MTKQLDLIGIGVFPLTLSRIEKWANLMWGGTTYTVATNGNWEWQKTIENQSANSWFPKYFNLPDTKSLEVLETQYAESSALEYVVDPKGARAGDKVKIKKPWELKFKQKPDWMDAFNLGDTTRWVYDEMNHFTYFIIAFLSDYRVDIRLLTDDNQDMLEDFADQIGEKIKQLFSNRDRELHLFVRNTHRKFEWV